MKIDVLVLCAAVLTATLAGCAATHGTAGSTVPVAADDRVCLTGTDHRSPENRCAVTGRSYSADEIRRTGATTAGEALQLLDPSVTIRR